MASVRSKLLKSEHLIITKNNVLVKLETKNTNIIHAGVNRTQKSNNKITRIKNKWFKVIQWGAKKTIIEIINNSQKVNVVFEIKCGYCWSWKQS